MLDGKRGLLRRPGKKARSMTSTARIRFYEELNDYLPPDRRKAEFDIPLRPGDTVEGLLRRLGVPSEVVDLVLVEGESCGLTRRLGSGERVSVYPVFESFDISPLSRIRSAPLRSVRFLAPPGLRALARALRLMGFDCATADSTPPELLPARAERESKILLTEGTGPAAHPRAIRLRKAKPLRQLLQVLTRLDLARSLEPLTRCLRCNGPLPAGGRGDAACPTCGRGRPSSSRLRRLDRLASRLRDRALDDPPSPEP